MSTTTYKIQTQKASNDVTVSASNGLSVNKTGNNYEVSGKNLNDAFAKLEPRVKALETKPDKDGQTLSVSGNNLTISGGNTVTLPIPVAQTPVEVAVADGLSVTRAGNKYTVSSKALLDRITALERKPDNDAQRLSISGNTLSLTNGGSVTLPTPATYNDTDIKRRLTALEGKADKDTVYNDTEVKNRISALERKADNDNQTLSVSGRNLSITRGNTVVIPDTSQPIFRIAKNYIGGNGSAGSTATTTISNLMNPDGLKVGDIVQDFYNSANNSNMGYFKVTAINGQNVTLQGVGFHDTPQAPTLAQFNDLNNKFNALKTDYDRVIQALQKIVSNLQSTGAWTGGITGSFVPNRNIATGNINIFGGTVDGNSFIRTNSGKTENDLAGGIS